MSTADILSTVSFISYVISGICLFLSVIFWFKFKIPSVIGDLSGRTARKSIAQMRANNEKSGVKYFNSSKTNVERGKLTETMSHTKRMTDVGKTQLEEERLETGILEENKAMIQENQETELLLDENETELLIDENETELLVDDNETVLLNEKDDVETISSGKQLNIIEEVVLIHTDERMNLGL